MIKLIFSALDEAKSLEKFLTDLLVELKILEKKFEIIICLDGTSDESLLIIAEFQKNYPIKVLPLINQRGLGIAYRRLFLDIIENSNDGDLVISLDSDNTHDPKQMHKMLRHFEENSLDFVVASRFCDASILADFPLHRRFISKSTSLILQKLFPIEKISGEKLQDYTSGYRVYRAKKLRELFLREKSQFISEPEFTYTCELLIKLSQLNLRADEIAISYDYGKKIGKSKLRILRNFWRLMILLLKLCAKRPAQKI